MVALISHPFRLLPNGSIAAREDSSTEYLAERIAVVLLVSPGERPLVPIFGVADPAYSNLDVAALTAQMSTFGIPVKIRGITKTINSDELTDYLVEFEKTGGK